MRPRNVSNDTDALTESETCDVGSPSLGKRVDITDDRPSRERRKAAGYTIFGTVYCATVLSLYVYLSLLYDRAQPSLICALTSKTFVNSIHPHNQPRTVNTVHANGTPAAAHLVIPDT